MAIAAGLWWFLTSSERGAHGRKRPQPGEQATHAATFRGGAWRAILDAVYLALRHPARAKEALLTIDGIAGPMLQQVEAGVHRNPPLVVMGFNPPKGKKLGVLSHRVYALEYRHIGDGQDYRHDFAAGVDLVVTSGGDVIHLYRPDGKPLARDFK